MTIRKKSEIYETLKADDNLNLDLNVKINEVKDIETKFGDKTLLIVETITEEEPKILQVFCNTINMNTLIDTFGEDDKNFIGKNINLTVIKDDFFKKNMILIKPID